MGKQKPLWSAQAFTCILISSTKESGFMELLFILFFLAILWFFFNKKTPTKKAEKNPSNNNSAPLPKIIIDYGKRKPGQRKQGSPVDTFEAEKERLRKKFETEPSNGDVKWSLLNKSIAMHVKEQQWGLYRNDLFDMAEILRKESKGLRALDKYFEVCYLDLNGPNNIGISDPDILAEFPPFSPDNIFLAPFVTDRIKRLTKELSLDFDKAKSRFIKVASGMEKRLKLPVNSDIAWEQLRAELQK